MAAEYEMGSNGKVSLKSSSVIIGGYVYPCTFLGSKGETVNCVHHIDKPNAYKDKDRDFSSSSPG